MSNFKYTATVLPQIDSRSVFPIKCLHGEVDINSNTYLHFVNTDTSRRSANKGILFHLNMTIT